MEDHARNCEGRNYTCTCGYDAARDAELDGLRKGTNHSPATRSRVKYAAGAYVDEQGIQYSGGIVERAFEAGAFWALEVGHKTLPCSCTMIEQDETCPVGYPSLLCEECDGKGHLIVRPPIDAVKRLRAYATGSNDVKFDTYDAADIVGYLERLSPSPETRERDDA